MRVKSTVRTYKAVCGQPKFEVNIPEGATAEEHPILFTKRVQQQDAIPTEFDVFPDEEHPGLLKIEKIEGKRRIQCRTYQRRQYSVQLAHGLNPLYDDRFELSHENLCDIEKAYLNA